MRWLLAALVLAGASINAQTHTSGDWQYTVSNGEATITGYMGIGGAVTIPSEVNGIPVRNVGSGSDGSGGPPIFETDSDYGNSSITSVVIPSGVMAISPYAFFGCSGLTSVTLPAGLSSIGSNAFEGCRNLNSISIPSSVTNIGSGAFWSCYQLYYVFIPDSVVPVLGTIFQEVTQVFPPHTTIVTSGLINALANDDAFVTAVANKILAASNNYGLATQSGVSNTITATTSNLVTQSEILTLATKTELTNALAQSRTDGINSVISNPNLWTLYTTNQIKNMAIGDLVLSKQVNGQFVLNYDIEQSEDMQTWTPYLSYALPMTNLPIDKAFVRIKAK